MSKNTTRKGLAFGAGLALVASGVAGVPAHAAGLTGYIGLAPTSGPESAYAVPIGTDADFSVTAQAASNIATGGVMKFLVTDPSGTVEPYVGDSDTGSLSKSGSYDEFPNSGSDLTASEGTETIALAADGTVTITTTHSFSKGDKIEFSVDVVNNSGAKLLLDDTIYEVATVDGTTAFTLVESAETVSVTFPVGGSIDAAATSNVLTLDDISSEVDPIPFGTDDTIKFDAAVENSNGIMLAANTVVTVLAASNDLADKLTVDGATDFADDGAGLDNETDAILVSAAADFVATTSVIRLVRTATTADNTYVVQTDINTVGTVALDLRNTSATTESTVEVVAWIDTFADDVIGSSEYVSATRTIKWVKASNITAVTTLTSPNVGDETLAASITTTPMLNGAQMLTDNEIRAVFTRADFATKLLAKVDGEQNATTGVWTNSIDLELQANSVGFTLDSYTVDGNETADDWATTPANVIPDVEMVGGADSDDTDGTTGVNEINTIEIATTKVVTVTTDAAHALSTGDLIDFTPGGTEEVSQVTTAIGNDRPVTVTGDKTFTFVMDTTADVTADSATLGDVEANTTIDVVTYTNGDNGNQYFLNSRVIPGDYSAEAYFNTLGGSEKWNSLGATSVLGTLSVTAADVILTTTGTASVQAIRENDSTLDQGTADLLLKTGTTAATVVATVVDEDGDAIGAGRSVSVTPSGASAGSGILVAGESVDAASLTTDANGQVEISIASTDANDGDVVDITVVAEGQAAATVYLEVAWADSLLTMVDLNMTDSAIDAGAGHNDDSDEQRYILEGTSYSMDVLVADQWFTGADSADYRIKVTGGAAIAGFKTLVDGKATVTISDNGTATDYDTVLTLQKKSTSGVFADTTAVKTISTKTTDDPGVLLGADGSSSYGMDGSEVADLSDAVAAKALVERDTRTSFVAQPVYTNSVVVTGKIVDDGTKTSLGGAVVTMSGPSNVLFVNGSVESRGSITFLASEADGEFDVTLFSTTAQTDSVITVTSMGVSETTEVSFTGAGVGEGTSLVVTMPAAVKPASTFQVKAMLSDVYGNGVDSAAASMKVTYTGPGIVYGTLPTETDSTGGFQFSVLLGSNDTGSVSVTVSYDQNADTDYLDAKDLVSSGTTAITATGEVASASKVNAGSFKGYVAIYAKGHEGSKLSAKVGNDWVIIAAIPAATNDLYRVVEFVGAGVEISVRIYIDRVLIETIPLLTK